VIDLSGDAPVEARRTAGDVERALGTRAGEMLRGLRLLVGDAAEPERSSDQGAQP